MAAGSGTGSPCGACKFLRRKCSPDCVFAPYFCSDQGPARFAAIHKVFGASNISKLLLHLPVNDRCEAVVTIAYEAQARIRDPVYGCVAHIFALQQQVAYLQAQVMQVKAQLAGNHQWHILGNNNDGNNLGAIQLLGNEQGSFLNPMEQGCNGNNVGVKLERSSQVYPRDDEFFLQHFQPCGRKRGHEDEMSEDLQELAFRIMSD